MRLTPAEYRPRLADATLKRKLATFGAVEVAGPKFCGKTWTSLNQAASITHVDDEAIRQLLELQPSLALEGETPHVIDEWQDVPRIWDTARREVDRRANAKAQFILTGSSTADKTQVSHSGAGRIARMRMRPMSLFESGLSDGSVSLRGLFEGAFRTQALTIDIRDLAEAICRGGWPASLDTPADLAGELPAQYLDALFEVSARKESLDPRLARRAAISLARNMGKSVTYKTIWFDSLGENESAGSSGPSSSLYRQKVGPYLSFFADQYFTEDQMGWDAPVKSRSRVQSKPHRTFADPSLPASLLGMTPERLLLERQLFGNLFEELCLRDLRVYASAMGQTPEPGVFYYGDADGLQVDAVIELADGRWGAFEIKLSDEKAPEGERSLLRLRDKIAANPAARNREPSFLAVLAGKASFARRLPSGVYVVPITTLGA